MGAQEKELNEAKSQVIQLQAELESDEIEEEEIEITIEREIVVEKRVSTTAITN